MPEHDSFLITPFDPKNTIKNREALYRMMISQLFYDGHQSIAVSLSNALQVQSCPPSDKLLKIATIGMMHENEIMGKHRSKHDQVLGPGIDLEFETDVQIVAPEPALYETAYVTSHKGNCRAGAFNFDGQLCATGSVDASIKILDVDRMLAKSAPDAIEPSSGEQQGHPVIRTLYDHLEEVTCLEFHPREQILASGSRDHTIKLFDFSKASVKKANKTITDSEQIRSISFHPIGDYMLVGTNHDVIRIYDIQTSQCYIARVPHHHHTSSVLCVRYSPDARVFVSCSRDGSIKLWDAVSNHCINTFQGAHEGTEVCSVIFSRNGKYLLSSGKDSLVKLWELSTYRCLIAYTGAGTTGKQEHRAQAVFNHSEDFVMYPDEATTSLCVWDSRTAARRQLLSLGHNGPVRFIVHSACSPAFLTCSDDFRARFWYRRNPTH